MGADLRAFAEVRGEKGWELCRNKPKRGKVGDVMVLPCAGLRDKLLFAILSAWEDNLPTVVTERGLPKDLSLDGRELAAGTVGAPGFCGHSWVLASELAAFPWSTTLVKLHGQRRRVSYAELFGEFLTTTLPVLTSLGAPDAVRMVYWVSY